VRYVNTEVMRLFERIGSPNLAEDLAVREHLARMLDEQRRSEYSVAVSFTSLPLTLTTRAVKIDLHVAGAEDCEIR